VNRRRRGDISAGATNVDSSAAEDSSLLPKPSEPVHGRSRLAEVDDEFLRPGQGSRLAIAADSSRRDVIPSF
jgi:hypothetical protein